MGWGSFKDALSSSILSQKQYSVATKQAEDPIKTYCKMTLSKSVDLSQDATLRELELKSLPTLVEPS